MNLTALIVQLIGGALGGYAAGKVSKGVNLVQSATLSSAHWRWCGWSGLFTLLGLSGTYKSSQL
jgi:hypothetical protein